MANDSSHAPRTRNMMYVQYLAHLPPKLHNIDDVIALIVDELKPEKYAAVLHDQDHDENGKLEEPHIHVVLQFANPRSIAQVAADIGDKPQYIAIWKGNVNNAYAYLVHATDDAKTKHQYDPADVKANFDYPVLLDKIKSKVSDARSNAQYIDDVLNALYSGDITEQEAKDALTGAQYGKAASRVKAVSDRRAEVLADQWREKMRSDHVSKKVVWIYGKAGVGKTLLATDYAAKLSDDDYYISGSHKDPLQAYKGQHTLILDELRPETISYDDLLKMLDPYNYDAFGASRYSDKPILANVIIITTPYEPTDFYDKMHVSTTTDSFAQLGRRITLTQLVTTTSVSNMLYNGQAYVREGMPRANPHPPKPSVHDNDANDLFDELNADLPELFAVKIPADPANPFTAPHTIYYDPTKSKLLPATNPFTDEPAPYGTPQVVPLNYERSENDD